MKELLLQTDGKDTTVKIQGELYRCNCGCNVFQHPVKSELYPKPEDIFVCNGCGNVHEAV